MSDLVCVKCGMRLRTCLLMAMAQDAGAHVHPSPTECAGGGDHEFSEPKPAPKETP
jgi:hypothetical protein